MSEYSKSEKIANVSTRDMLYDIFGHFARVYGLDEGAESVEVAKTVASSVSSFSHREWTWRYVISIKNGTIESSRFIDNAIEKCWNSINGTPLPVLTIPCPTCGSAPTVCLCDGSQVVKPKPPKKQTKTYPRRAIRLDDPESAAASIIGANPSREYLHRLAELLEI